MVFGFWRFGCCLTLGCGFCFRLLFWYLPISLLVWGVFVVTFVVFGCGCKFVCLLVSGLICVLDSGCVSVW